MPRNHLKIIRSVTVPQSLGFCREVMIKMRDRGYEMVAVTSPGPELESLRDDDGFHSIEVPMERHISIFKDLWSLLLMIKVLRKERPQVVHSMTPKAGLISMIAAWMTGVPVRIHTFTGLVWPTSTGLKRKILMATDWLTCACSTHVTPEGHGVLNDLKEVTKKPMKVLGYGNVRGIDMERFNPIRVGRSVGSDSPFTFLFVGRIVGDKGINELVEAFVDLNRKYPGTRLVLVGDFEAELDPLLETTQNLISENSLIVVAGSKSGDELVQTYANSDCFVMPSYREGFPNTVMEAGAMGLPCIVTDINGSREIIEDGKNGLVVSPRSVQPLYDAMERIFNDKDLREKLQKDARSMIESRFEKNFVQQCQIDFYEEILRRYDN